MSELTLWSLRFTPARGSHWAHERAVSEDTKDRWLEVFKGDEPQTLFVVSRVKPSQPATERITK